MDITDANVKDSDEGRNQALHALLTAISPDSGQNQTRLTPEVVQRLSDKLTELVGGGAVDGLQRDEGGELLNEEGLPIIDIAEPLPAAELRGNGDVLLVEEETLVPLATLPPTAKERLRHERDRILDLLEEEERLEHTRTIEQALEETRESSRKRKETATDLVQLKAAREMQKKMGKALLRNMAEAREQEEKLRNELVTLADKDSQGLSSAKAAVPKKSVAFADVLADDDRFGTAVQASSTTKLDWGDVTPARLRSTKRPTLMSGTKVDTHPMKMAVVERVPGGQQTIPIIEAVQKDSDDESDTVVSEDDGELPHIPGDQEDDEDGGFPPDTDDEGSDEGMVLEEEVIDVNFAQQQREIALEYHKKRAGIGEVAAAAMRSHTHTEDEFENASLEMPAVTHSKPSMSQFKASRLASSYSAAAPSSSTSVSLDASVLPASSVRTLQRSIRTGKLDSDNRLVGGESGDSASEEENEGMQEILELLKKGEVYNVGPDGEYLHTVPPAPSDSHKATASNVSPSLTTGSTGSTEKQRSLPPLSTKHKVSRFKVARSQAGRPSAAAPATAASLSSVISLSATPISNAGRSSPKSPAPADPTIIERRAPRVQQMTPQSNTPAIIESSSFLQPQNSSSRRTVSPAATPTAFSMIVDSPSFPALQGSSKPPAITSSPSFPPPPTLRRPTRPPMVMSSAVRESVPGRSSQQEKEAEPERKVSRFLADRM